MKPIARTSLSPLPAGTAVGTTNAPTVPRILGKRLRALVSFLVCTVAAAVYLTSFASAATAGTKKTDWKQLSGAVTVTDGTGGTGASLVTDSRMRSEAALREPLFGTFTVSADITFPADPTGGVLPPAAYFSLKTPGDTFWLLLDVTNSNGTAAIDLTVLPKGAGAWIRLLQDNDMDIGSQTINVTMAHEQGSGTLYVILSVDGVEIRHYGTGDPVITDANFYSNPGGLAWTLRNGEGGYALPFSDTRYETTTLPATTTVTTTTRATTTTTASATSVSTAAVTDAAAGAAESAGTAGTSDMADVIPAPVITTAAGKPAGNGMPAWAWTAIGAAAVIVVGGGMVFVILKGKKKKADDIF